jgi:hypothetical protein
LQHESNVSLEQSEKPYDETAALGAILNRERARGEANAHLKFQQLCDSDQELLHTKLKKEDKPNE